MQLGFQFPHLKASRWLVSTLWVFFSIRPHFKQGFCLIVKADEFEVEPLAVGVLLSR